MESSVDPEDDSDTASEDESLTHPLDREREVRGRERKREKKKKVLSFWRRM